MDHIFVILAFAIFENSGHFASACSLLPGGKPKCFPDAVDYETTNPQLKEIKYRLDKKHIFGYDCNTVLEHLRDDLKDVRLGQYWEKKIGTKKDTVM
ncbi:hypothetical protein LSTR_LSTR015650 [Laodelphax striatellus]|nr:hypothetical protein LSTR_LSTR015650 [Laodelphax striatellus]